MDHLFVKSDALRLPLPDCSADLCFGSPPYIDQRLYLEDGVNLGIARKIDEWISWMLAVTAEALRVSRGAVLWVAAGKTKGRNYWPACEGLMADWARYGVGSGEYLDGLELPRRRPAECHAYRPCYWRRVGIPGSGQDQWFRSDIEYVMCFKRPGRLPWADNTAMGRPPKFGTGGAMANRRRDGSRANAWGGNPTSAGRLADGRKSTRDLAFSVSARNPGVIANPGNLVDTGSGGGGAQGHPLAHENEAPFPEDLAEHFIRSLAPPGGLVLDPFSGSGTTVATAVRLGRRGIGGDLRMSQCRLGARRLAEPHVRAKKKPRPAPVGQLPFGGFAGAHLPEPEDGRNGVAP